MAKVKYRARYVLATGYPGIEGEGVAIYRDFEGLHNIDLDRKFPKGLVDDPGAPRYRLVLERVK